MEAFFRLLLLQGNSGGNSGEGEKCIGSPFSPVELYLSEERW